MKTVEIANASERYPDPLSIGNVYTFLAQQSKLELLGSLQDSVTALKQSLDVANQRNDSLEKENLNLTSILSANSNPKFNR